MRGVAAGLIGCAALGVAVPAHTAAMLAQAATASSPAATAAAPSPRDSRVFEVGQQDIWTVTDLEVQPGDRVVFAATGAARCPGVTTSFGPEGSPRGFRDLLRILPVAQAGRGALVGRIGAPDVAVPFTIGTASEVVSPVGGVLSLGVNHTEGDACAAAFSVRVDRFASDGAARVPVHTDGIDGVDDGLFARLPRRIGDLQGNPGDMVNFLIVGSEAGMKQAFTRAGWVTVDPDVRGAVISGLLSSLSKESYLTLPMSQLYLFGRPQDFGWAHAEPIKVAASRHHLRLWRAPFTVANGVLWAGAATHDIGFDRDRRNNGITHKIDPDIDLERAYVEQTLAASGLVSEFTYVLPTGPLQDARTATGGSFHSDGRVLVLKLLDPLPAASTATPAR
jgi:hypothetical protein